MDKNEGDGLSESEKVSRFGCGTFLGVFLGILFIVKLALSSFGVIAAVIAFSVFACGILAVKHGDEFWHSLKNWDWWQ